MVKKFFIFLTSLLLITALSSHELSHAYDQDSESSFIELDCNHCNNSNEEVNESQENNLYFLSINPIFSDVRREFATKETYKHKHSRAPPKL
jgi:hypothetical protein|tara:strand:+ start:3336 stop:3611 length:276 start_codon:yes stop_codon:yes gene_type:complete